MRKIFIEQSLLKDDTFLYGVQMPGYMAMCMMGSEGEMRNKQFPFTSPEEISKEDLKDFGNLYIIEEGSPMLDYMAEELGDSWEFVIGIAVNKEKETSRDIIIPLEEVIDENIKKFNQIFKGEL